MGQRTAFIGAMAALGVAGMLLAPVAMATTSTTTPTTTTTTTSPTKPSHPLALFLTPKSGRAGATVTINARCSNPSFSTAALDIDFDNGGLVAGDPQDPSWNTTQFSAKVRDVKPGSYPVTLTCQDERYKTPSGPGKVTATFTVLPKAQVPTKPVGAPQTGGGFTATDLVG
ncbi:hypothetical protein [Kutzneria sp. NPDC051319]|uniref:hypothetical protein n=1 Tax=Kutzneria sp. NPDC051319 TaxID=3155047 RepID=UPI003432CADF